MVANSASAAGDGSSPPGKTKSLKQALEASRQGGIWPEERRGNKEPRWVENLDQRQAEEVRAAQQKRVWNPDNNRYEQMPYLPVPDFEVKKKAADNREQLKS